MALGRTNNKIAYWGPRYPDRQVLNQICPREVTADQSIWTVDSSCRWGDLGVDLLFTADTTIILASSVYTTTDEGA